MKNILVNIIVFFFIGIISLFAQEDFEDDIDDFSEPISTDLSSNWLLLIAIILIVFLFFYKQSTTKANSN